MILSTIVILALAIAAFVLGRGFELSTSGDGTTLKMDGALGQATQDEIDDSQPELEEAVADARESVSQSGAQTTASVSIAGTWINDFAGTSYRIEQSGSAAAITEFDLFGNVTAAGQGTISGDVFDFTYQSVAGSGSGSLTVSAGGTELSGYWQDSFGRRDAFLRR